MRMAKRLVLGCLLGCGLGCGLLGGCGADPAAVDAAAPDLATLDAAAPDLAPPADLAATDDAFQFPPQITCDPIAQDCTDPARPKCSITVDANGTLPRCVQSLGAKKEGEACLRLGAGTAAQGHDDCARGLFCTFIGAAQALADPPRACRRFCRADKDCGASAMCVRLDGVDPADGACVPTCTLFGSDCPMGMACAYPTSDVDGADYFATCRSAGAVADGAPCASQLDCGSGSFCLDPSFGNQAACTPICDANHPCARGKCLALPSLPAGGGICK